MNFSAFFVNRPIATTLFFIGVAFSGILSFYLLPVASLPQIEFPVIQVQASLSGASAQIMASAVATPLEKALSRVSGVNDMTSSSSLGTSKISLQFNLSRNIDGAARDVQAAINAAASDLPSNMNNPPTYRKLNPADSPIMVIALTSNILPLREIYDVASTEVQQSLLKINGVGQVIVAGSSPPAVRIALDNDKLTKYNLGINQIIQQIQQNNDLSPKGMLTDNLVNYQIIGNDQLVNAKEYQQIIINNHNNANLRLGDLAQITDSVQDVKNNGIFNNQQAILLVIFKAPGSNVIEVINAVNQQMKIIKKLLHTSITTKTVLDRSQAVAASLFEVKKTLCISVLCVVAVVYLFLGSFSSIIIPAAAMIISLLGTFTVMYLLGFSLNILSLMALTISTGFVVDDAIVVLENISRYAQQKMNAKDAAIKGATEIVFTVISISLSLVIVFLPILLMGGIVGRLFREFAVTLSVAVLISMLVSLCLTPLMCSFFVKPKLDDSFSSKFFDKIHEFYGKTLTWVLAHQKFILVITVMTFILNGYLFKIVGKGFFPQQDTGRIIGSLVVDQKSSFDYLNAKLKIFVAKIKEDPAVENVVGFISSGNFSSATVFIILKDLKQRKISLDEVIGRLRKNTSLISGANFFMQAGQDLVIGGRQGNAQYQFTLTANQIEEVNYYTPLVMEIFKKIPGVVDVNSDISNTALEAYLEINKTKAALLGLNSQDINKALFYSFGQASISTIYQAINQYYVILENQAVQKNSINVLENLKLTNNNNQIIPLAAFATIKKRLSLNVINHQSLSPAATISFNLIPGYDLGRIVDSVKQKLERINLPEAIRSSFRGTAQAFQDSMKSTPLLLAAAIFAVYLVLGILYEDLLHPVTILSTLLSAGVGGVLALVICKVDLTIIAMIGLLLLIGIVKKNAIMLIDFVLETKKTNKNMPVEQAVYHAALLRLRPILMTSSAALLGAVPMVLNNGLGSEMQKPLGIVIIGGMIFSQILTIYSTPVIFLKFEQLKNYFK